MSAGGHRQAYLRGAAGRRPFTLPHAWSNWVADLTSRDMTDLVLSDPITTERGRRVETIDLALADYSARVMALLDQLAGFRVMKRRTTHGYDTLDAGLVFVDGHLPMAAARLHRTALREVTVVVVADARGTPLVLVRGAIQSQRGRPDSYAEVVERVLGRLD